jgi:hypothetical protein
MNIIFLDIDGVLNCQEFYTKTRSQNNPYPLSEICTDRVTWLNELCTEIAAKVVISSSWRHGSEIEGMRAIFKELGATFEIIDYTPSLGRYSVRGNEILAWIENNYSLLGKYSSDFHTYAIIDDDSDMLLWQRENFFQTDSYSGLTPNTCYKIKRFFSKFSEKPRHKVLYKQFLNILMCIYIILCL